VEKKSATLWLITASEATDALECVRLAAAFSVSELARGCVAHQHESRNPSLKDLQAIPWSMACFPSLTSPFEHVPDDN